MSQKEKMKIFIVDDDKFYLNLFNQLLYNLGYTQVFAFESGRECLDKIHIKPDVVFLDYQMENMTGSDVLKRIKMESPKTQVIMVTGQDQEELKETAQSYGAFDYIIKGIDTAQNISEVMEKMNKPKKSGFRLFF